MCKVHPRGSASAPLLSARSFPGVLRGLAWFVHLLNIPLVPAKRGRVPCCRRRGGRRVVAGCASADCYGGALRVALWSAQAEGAQRFLEIQVSSLWYAKSLTLSCCGTKWHRALGTTEDRAQSPENNRQHPGPPPSPLSAG